MSDRRIEDYALIGDGETAALVGREGAIEWLCFPRFDSDACCAAMLGDRENGCWHITLGDDVTSRSRRYRGDSLILETELTCSTGTLLLTDFMPIRGKAPDVVRIMECTEGEVEVTSELFLRFDYGRIHPLVRAVSKERSLAISGPHGVSLDFDDAIDFADRRFTTRCRLTKGERRRHVLTWYPSYEDPPERVDPERALADTEAYWSEWIGKMQYGGRYRDLVARSLITLKALIYRPTGGIVAAPTSSLPEHMGGERNWDYRYCWVRDATFTLLALIELGFDEEATDWVGWLRRAVGGDPIDLQPFYGVDGEPRAIEWEADWLRGFGGSRPVRFGNGAQGQLQLDGYGEVIDCLFYSREHGLADSDDLNQLVRMLAARLAQVWREPDAGIWESRGQPIHHTYSKAMCWVGFDRAARFFADCDADLSHHYADLADEARALVLAKAWNEQRGCFTRGFEDAALDAALLRLPIVGLIRADDPRMAATIEAIERELCKDGLVHRYSTGDTDDGLSGKEGAFMAAGFWLADAMHLQGRVDDARRQFEGLVARASDLGLMAEEYDATNKRQLGNFPQALSHLALLRTACRLEGGHEMDRESAS